MKKLLFLLILMSFSVASFAFFQDADISGKWSGTSNWGKNISTIEFDLKQNGQNVTGEVVIAKAQDASKRARYKVTGSIHKNALNLKATTFVEKFGTWCLPRFVLKYSTENGIIGLNGKWKHNAVKGGCLIGLSGLVNTTKVGANQEVIAQLNEGSENVENASRSSKKRVIADEDFEGTELAKALRSRQYYALIIGVQDYTDDSINDLDYPISDGSDLGKVLIDNYTFEKENVYQLSNPTRTEIIETLDNLSQKIQETDNLLVFYGGHGIWDEQLEQGFWLPSNAKETSKAEWLSNGTIRDYLRAINSKHTLLIADACFSGGILRERNAFNASRAMLEMYKLPSRKAMTSGALKTVPDKSVFMEYLVKNLKNNADPFISAEQLFHRLKVAVINNSANGQVPQYGTIHQADDEGGDFIFLRRH